jgi:hypothetical protein
MRKSAATESSAVSMTDRNCTFFASFGFSFSRAEKTMCKERFAIFKIPFANI